MPAVRRRVCPTRRFLWSRQGGLLIIVVFVRPPRSALEDPGGDGVHEQVWPTANVIAEIVIFVSRRRSPARLPVAWAKLLGDTPTGKVDGDGGPSLVMLIAVFMILNQLKIAPEIVTITYTALLFTVALASALAFGLGGRQVAADMLDSAYRKGQQQQGQVKADLQKGKERGQEQAERGKQKAQAEVGNSGAPSAGAQRADA